MARLRWIQLLVIIVFTMGLASAVSANDEVPRMSIDALNAMLDNPDLLILDVRQKGDWDANDLKIKGAERRDPSNFGTWKDQLPRDKTIVLYCA